MQPRPVIDRQVCMPALHAATAQYVRVMAQKIWRSREEFAADARAATDVGLLEMYRWAVARERAADAPGTGRATKGRRLFNSMTRSAAEELERRELSF